MKDYHINVFYSEDDEGYIADILDLQHCSAFGAIPEEALQEVLKAKQVWLAAARASKPYQSRGIVRSFIKRCERRSRNSPTEAGTVTSAASMPGSVQPRRAGDGLQPTLRCSFQLRLTPSVRCLKKGKRHTGFCGAEGIRDSQTEKNQYQAGTPAEWFAGLEHVHAGDVGTDRRWRTCEPTRA